jgi:alkanesulfonate monooxygenase SsuD/methylene tetrahydromethanopterin reductase-like flavin-dependent oxidoreductase (luciferase family)
MTGFVVGADETDLRSRARRLADRTGTDPDPARLREAEPGWIVGTLEDAVEQLAALRDAGVSRMMLQNLLHTELEVIELIGVQLAPVLR